MTLTIDLTPEEETRLREIARSQGLDAEELVAQAIKRLIPARTPMTGAEIAAYWEREGAVPLWQDRADSPELAREFRRKAETRSRD